ncbi:MAG: vWA domain-containing protein [Gemmataceae bacterium]
MNDNVTTQEHTVFRRLEDPFPGFGFQLPDLGEVAGVLVRNGEGMWFLALLAVLALALTYVGFMYRKDAKGVGAWWATFLGTLRVGVYLILAAVFLLPSRQTTVTTVTESKVILMTDVSDSFHTSDDLPTGVANEKLVTRMDRVIEFLESKKANFVAALEKKNPLFAYRFASRLDDDYLHFSRGLAMTRREREKPDLDDDGKAKADGPAFSAGYWRAWLSPRLRGPAGDIDARRFARLADSNATLVKEKVPAGTNIADAVLAVMNKEASSRVQGIIVITDGRSNEGSPASFRELEKRSADSKIPIFVVGVGEDRDKVRIEITDQRVPQAIQPEDRFRVATEVVGEGLANQKLDLTLEVTHVRTYKTKVNGKDGKMVEEEREELLPIEVVERENPDAPKATRARHGLGTKITLKPAADAVLDKSNPPRLEADWQLDAVALAAAAKIDLTSGGDAGKKWEFGETKDDSEIRFVAKVPADRREGLGAKKEHDGPKGAMKVIKKPLRVLLVAAGANREYQFVRTLFVREVEKKRLELSVCLQLPPGQATYRPGVVQDVPPERMLNGFPDTFKAKKDGMDLQSYDVIVAFDPDFKQLEPPQVANLKSWAEAGGGLVLVGGYINTVELIRPEEGKDVSRYQPLLDLLPVVLADRRDIVERKADDPYPLDLAGATPELEFMKLDEELDESKFKEDWQAYFFGLGKDRTEKAQRGFYGIYPVKKVKTGSVVVARYKDPSLEKMEDGTEQAYLVVAPEALPRVVWLGSAEMWRLREFKEEYHERFWTKLVRYAAAKSKGTASKPIRIEMGNNFPALRYVDVEAKIDASGGEPLDRSAKPEVRLLMPPGVSEKEIKQPVIMTPRPGARDGWFSARFQVRSAGEYELTVKVPRGPGVDNEMIETRKFVVKESNPELDNTKPDFDRMYRMASEADFVLARMEEADRAELRRQLVRPKLPAADAGGEKEKQPALSDKARLYFNLKNAELIPACMRADVQTAKSKGPHRDLWDEGWTVAEGKKSEDPSVPEKRPVKVSYVLAAVVGLLCLEWLTRKLLRLA